VGSEVPNWPRKLPTIKRFFQVGQSLGLNQDEYFGGLFDLMQKRWGLNEEMLVHESAETTVETALSLFETEQQFHPLAPKNPQDRAYWDGQYPFGRAKELLHRYIREVLLGSGAVPDHPGEGCPLHAAIAAHLEPSDAVISFNYDLIMDKALKDTGQWNEWLGYSPMTFQKIYHMGHWYDQPSVSCSSERTYLKLHGSINWFASTGIRATQQSADLHRIEQDPEHPQRRVFSLHSSRAVTRSLEDSEALFEDQYCEQLLVPPMTHKSYELFRPLWNRAEETLVGAKQLVIIGFSFSPADVQAQWLLRRGLAQNSNAVSVTLVDPDDQVRQRIKAIVASVNGRHSVQNEYRSLRDLSQLIFNQLG